MLLGRAGHDRGQPHLRRIDAGLLGVVALGDGAEHLLGGLASGEVRQEFGVEVLDEVDPARRAARDHRQRPALGQALDELAPLLHDGEVGGELRVEDLVEAEAPEGRGHLAGDEAAGSHAEGLAQGSPDRRRRLDHDGPARVGQGAPKLVGLVVLGDGARRADNRALAALYAGAGGEAAVHEGRDSGADAAPGEADGRDALHLGADGHAATAEDAFVVVAHEAVGRGVELGGLPSPREADVPDAQRPRRVLQLAGAGARAGEAVGRVVREEELYGVAPSAQDPRRGRGHLHAFGDRAHARAHEGFGALDLDDAEPAGRVGRNILEMAERGHLGPRRRAGIEEAGTSSPRGPRPRRPLWLSSYRS